MGYLKPQPRGWFPATNANPNCLLKINSSEAHLAEKPVFPRLGEETRYPDAASPPSPTEFRVRGARVQLPPGAGRLLPASVHWAAPSFLGWGDPGPKCGRGRGRGGGRWHPSHLKSRSRPWVWLRKRVKASMASSPRPSVAPASDASPQGRRGVPAGGSATRGGPHGVSPPGAGAPWEELFGDFRQMPEVVVTRATPSRWPR